MEYIGSKDLWAEGVKVKVTATVQELKENYGTMYLRYIAVAGSTHSSGGGDYSSDREHYAHGCSCFGSYSTSPCRHDYEFDGEKYSYYDTFYRYPVHHYPGCYTYEYWVGYNYAGRRNFYCAGARYITTTTVPYIDTYSVGTTTRDVSVETTTDRNGYYSVQIPINKYTVDLTSGNGYSVLNPHVNGPYYEYITKVTVTFEYNGAEYEVTYDYNNNQTKYTAYNNSGNGAKLTSKDGLRNNAQETDRDRSNLKTITLNKDKNNKEIPYTYDGKTKTSSLNIAKGNNTENYKDVSYKDSDFAKEATTGNINTPFNINTANQNIKNICLALSPRTVDLALYMNVDHTAVSINGKTTTYTEPVINIDTNEAIKEWINKNANIDVNIYPTDYYYRIADYQGESIAQTDSHDGNEVRTGNNLNTKTSAELAKGDKVETDELDIKVTYKVTMLKQAITAGSSQINQLVYYYDSDKYTLTKIDGNYKDYQVADSSKYTSIDGYNAIVVNGAWNTDKDNPTLYFTFTVNKDENKAIKTGKVKDNIVAITSYSTQHGFLDVDSSTKKDINWEDDTSKAQSVTVNVTSEKRTISGNVFDDLDRNGMLNDGESINDVVVQLIEITKNNNEYIWQETVAGKNEVKSLVQKEPGDYKLYTYTVSNNIGDYKFENVVPGNYIVRFIYGDGYNYDINVNTTKYNGTDYKSTKDPNYNLEWYNSTNYFGTGASVARDNEARRLEVMATTTEIDSELGTVLDVYAKDKKLEDLTYIEKENIVSYIKKLANIDKQDVNPDNELSQAMSKVFSDVKTYSDVKSKARNIIVDDNCLKVLKKCIAYKTFMTSETSKVNMPVDVNTLNTTKDNNIVVKRLTIDNKNVSTQDISNLKYNKVNINFTNVNFGVMSKPQVKLELEKHITALKVTPNGNGENPIIDARANITDILNGNLSATGETKGLQTTKSERNNRGMWNVQTDVEELSQGANLEVEYTYVVKNVGDKDYISTGLANSYVQGQDNYIAKLKEILCQGSSRPEDRLKLKNDLKGNTHNYGTYLGQYYYTGDNTDTDAEVPSRVDSFGEAINNQLRFETETAGNDFRKVNTEKASKTIYDTNGIGKAEEIETVVETVASTAALTSGHNDTSKKLKLTKVLASLNSDDNGNIPSYIAEVLKYSSASGGRNKEAIPANLSYVHSKDNEMTLQSCTYELNGETYEAPDISSVPQGAKIIRKPNETDEFWGETIMIGKPTGENKILPVQIGIVVAISVAVIGVGIVLIRKIVLTK